MADFKWMEELHQKNGTKMVLLVMDGLGGLPMTPGGPTELEAANTPHMDRLAKEGALGQTVPIRRGITPGSGPAHLALFGYDPLHYDVGRGVLEASGVGVHVHKGDVAARGNFCTVDADGNITDRRAGRISSEEAMPILEKLKHISLPGVSVETKLVREYRFAVVMRGDGLESDMDDTDPQKTGVPPLPAVANQPGSARAAELYNQWIQLAREALKDEPKANAMTLRGFSTDPALPQFPDIYGLRAACIAVYPMYRGVSHLVGMEVQGFSGEHPEDEFAAAARLWDEFDFFFIHIKKTDSKGEDGDFDGKVSIIESVDQALPDLLALKPDVLAITGDHSTPARMKSHSFHPVPTLMWAPATVREDTQTIFGERACAQGGLGTFPATDLLPMMLGHANRLAKFGA